MITTGEVLAVVAATRTFRRGAEAVRAVDAVTLELRTGELTVVAGPSGSGKTTLLSLFAGTEPVDQGRVLVHPPLPAVSSPDQLGWDRVALVPQAPALLEELTVAENVDLPARLDPGRGSSGAGDGPGTRELLESLEIFHLADRFPSWISGGEQQRTAVARALRLRPAVLFGDEPTGHQDRARVGLLLEILRAHAASGAAVMLASHDDDVIAAADRVVTVADGRVTSDTGGPRFAS